jgi:hypothetical protein
MRSISRDACDVITTDRPAHLCEAAALAEVNARRGHVEISDACAVTIASWWQSPGTVGRAFARLASTGSVVARDLADDLAATFAELRPLGLNGDNSDEWRALEALATWALYHPSRT